MKAYRGANPVQMHVLMTQLLPHHGKRNLVALNPSMLLGGFRSPSISLTDLKGFDSTQHVSTASFAVLRENAR